MEIHEIESLSFAEIKARKDELVVAVKGADALPSRYISALQDAKQRDEKLAEQGKTITALQEALDAVNQRAEIVEDHLTAANAQIAFDIERAVEQDAKRDAALTEARDKIPGLLMSLNVETDRANRLAAEAMRGRTAMSGAAKQLNDALAALAVEIANSGE